MAKLNLLPTGMLMPVTPKPKKMTVPKPAKVTLAKPKKSMALPKLKRTRN